MLGKTKWIFGWLPIDLLLTMLGETKWILLANCQSDWMSPTLEETKWILLADCRSNWLLTTLGNQVDFTGWLPERLNVDVGDQVGLMGTGGWFPWCSFWWKEGQGPNQRLQTSRWIRGQSSIHLRAEAREQNQKKGLCNNPLKVCSNVLITFQRRLIKNWVREWQRVVLWCLSGGLTKRIMSAVGVGREGKREFRILKTFLRYRKCEALQISKWGKRDRP